MCTNLIFQGRRLYTVLIPVQLLLEIISIALNFAILYKIIRNSFLKDMMIYVFHRIEHPNFQTV